MSTSLGVAADLLVMVLLVATIVTSVRLSRRMAGLKAHETVMRETIAELVTATENAERAIGALKASVAECDRSLIESIDAADRSGRKLGQAVASGQAMAEQLERTLDATRRAFQTWPGIGREAPDVPKPGGGRDLRAVLASAQALAERSASRGRGGSS